jgi:hypothetical protein
MAALRLLQLQHLRQNRQLKSKGVTPAERPSALPRLVLSFDLKI